MNWVDRDGACKVRLVGGTLLVAGALMHAIEPVDSLEIVQIQFNYTLRQTLLDACPVNFWIPSRPSSPLFNLE